MSSSSSTGPRGRNTRRVKRSRGRRALGRHVLFETLEDRRLLAADWQNAYMAPDVNNDLKIGALDALLLVNKLNAGGGGPLPSLEPGARPDAYYDTSGDGILSAIDVLRVANAINNNDPGYTYPVTVDIVPVNGTTLLATYSRPMGASALDPANYQLTGDDGQPVEVTGAEFVGEGESVVQLQTTPQSSFAYTVNIQNVTDGVGQNVFFEGRKLLTGNPKGAVVSVAATSPTRVVVVFNEAMADNALAPQNYSIKDASGKSLMVTDARFNGPLGMVFVLTTETQSGVDYQLVVSNVTDLQNDGLEVNTGNFRGIAGQPKLLSVAPAGPNSLLVTYSQAMSDDVLSPAAYVIKSASGQTLEVLSAQFIGSERRLVQLNTGPQSPGTYTIQSINASDVNRNPVSAPGAAGVFQGAPAPSLLAAIPVDSTHVVLTFGTPLGDSGLSPSSYKLEKLDAQGNAVGTLPISAAAFVGSQRAVVSLATPYQSTARYRIATTNGLFDASGSRLAVVSLEFQGLGTQAKVNNAEATSPTSIRVSFNVPMSDDALVPAAYVIKDPSGVALPVFNVQFVGTDRRIVQLTTGPQAAVEYTIISINATDLGGGALAIPGPTGKLQGATAATLTNATAIDSTHIYLTFAGPIGDSALSPASYTIESLDGNGNVIGNLTPSSAAFVGNQRTVVSLTTPAQTSGLYRLRTTNALKDALGVSIPIVERTLQGIGSQAQLVAVSSTSPTTLIVTFNVPMSDDALSPSLYVIHDENGNQLQVTNAQFIGTEHRLVQLTTAPQISQSYTVVSINATDVGGSTTIIPTNGNVNTFPGPITTAGSSVPVDGPPRVTGAASLSNTSVLVAFSEPMSDEALNTSNYFIVQDNVNPEVGYIPVLGAVFNSPDHRAVILTTGSQNELTYSVTAVNLTDQSGNTLAPSVLAGGQRIDPTTASFPGSPAGLRSVATIASIVLTEDRDADGAIGLGDLITDNQGFKHLVRDRNGDEQLTLDEADGITDANSNGVIDAGDTVIIPAGFGFDADGDGLSDNIELRGWTVSVTLLNGDTVTRQVTSDPFNPDSDGDELWDAQELNIGIDPRSADTDGDQLSDYAEFNEIYSDPWSQDTDGDGLDDFLEFDFFKTSPFFADSDGDQIDDADEILGNRNPRVADLPRPEISIGAVTQLAIDVRFTEVNDKERRELQTKSFGSSLARSDSQTFSRTDTVNVEAHMEVATGFEGADFSFNYTIGGSVGYVFEQSSESATEIQRTYEESFSTDQELTLGSTLEREVVGAVMKVAVDLRNVSNLAYRVKNLQVTAFIQDPQDHSRLTPVATLLPESEPEEGFTLGPFAAEKGPFIFSNDTIIPSLVESLMANSSGLIFRISNYDIIDEADRNFAFTSQEIVERTSRLVIDYGGASYLRALLGGEAFDEIQPGDETEIFRVATSAGQVIDNRRAIFDGSGKEVGITIFEALSAVGLTRYDEATTPMADLTDDELLHSYSTVMEGNREKIFRIRSLANDALNQKYWEILTPLGIDASTDLKDLILKSNSPVSLNFVQDLDGDQLTADVEFFLRTSDSPLPVSASDPTPRGRDTDRDGLDDRYEALIGWTVSPIGQRPYKVWSAPNRADSNFDDPDADEDPLNEYDFSDLFAAPGGWNDVDGDGLRDPFNEVFQLPPQNGVRDYVLDPVRRDTDLDGISDAQELVGFWINPITGSSPIFRGLNPLTGLSPDPLNYDSDFDTFPDGEELIFGLDPTDPDDKDTDGDGLPDLVEDTGWNVTTFGVSSSGFQQGLANTVRRTADKKNVDTDGDGLTDREEFFLKTNARSADTDGDGILDRLELLGFVLPHKVGGMDLQVIKTDVLDADTDNDKRSDGSEAELQDIELNAWVVRVSGQAPYRVWSHPLLADADFDLLVDGDEFALDILDATRHSDPNLGDTDGDAKDDGVEFRTGTNPLADDIRVTVVIESIEYSWSGLDAYNFEFKVRQPGEDVAGMEKVPHKFLEVSDRQVGRVHVQNRRQSGNGSTIRVFYEWKMGENGNVNRTAYEPDITQDGGPERVGFYDPGEKGVPPGALFRVGYQIVAFLDDVISPDWYTYNGNETAALGYQLALDGVGFRIWEGDNTNPARPPISEGYSAVFPAPGFSRIDFARSLLLDSRSLAFGLARGERFSVEASFNYLPHAGAWKSLALGGLEGKKAYQLDSTTDEGQPLRSVFAKDEIASKFIEDFYFEETLPNGSKLTIKFYYIVG